MRELLSGVLQRAKERRATEADADLGEEQHSSVQVRLGKVETVTHSREQRLALRVFAGKASASASTSDLSPESGERLVDEAVALARLTAPDPVAGLPEPGECASTIPDLGLEDPAGHGLTPEEKIAIARQAEAAALDCDPRMTNSEGAEFFERRARYAYATSHGFFGSYPTSSFGLTVSPVASANGGGQRGSWDNLTRQ